jgi:hypothetical protein
MQKGIQKMAAAASFSGPARHDLFLKGHKRTNDGHLFYTKTRLLQTQNGEREEGYLPFSGLTAPRIILE